MIQPVTFIQSADAYRYRAMLDLTSRTVTAYCKRWNCDYQAFIGRKRGDLPWHATFNRIFQLTDLVELGYRGWIFHLDADAFINDLSFDVHQYLSDKGGYAAILVPSGATDAIWDVNIGVAAFNVGCESGRKLVHLWRERLDSLSGADFHAMRDWSVGWNDQNMFHAVLEQNSWLTKTVHFEQPAIMNSFYARFIRQLMRDHAPDLEYRIDLIRQAVNQVMIGYGSSAAQEEHNTDLERAIVAGLHQALLAKPVCDSESDRLVDALRRQALEQGVEAVAADLLLQRDAGSAMVVA